MARENRWPEYPARIFGHHVGKAGRAMPAQTAAAMPLGAHCNHCEADDAVVPISDYEKDRFVYVCVYCGWWGLDPLRMDSPPTDETSSTLAQKRAARLRSKRR
jgi:hypothetical protein